MDDGGTYFEAKRSNSRLYPCLVGRPGFGVPLCSTAGEYGLIAKLVNLEQEVAYASKLIGGERCLAIDGELIPRYWHSGAPPLNVGTHIHP